MLYIVKQYKALLGALLKNEFAGAEGWSMPTPDSDIISGNKHTGPLRPQNSESFEEILKEEVSKGKKSKEKVVGTPAQKAKKEKAVKLLDAQKQTKKTEIKAATQKKIAKTKEEITSTAFKSLDIDSAQYTLQYLDSLSNRSLSKGDGGANVSKLQYALLNLGYNLGNTGESENGADGDFGPKVKAAVKSLQADLGLDVTGDFTDATFNKLKSELTNVVVVKKAEAQAIIDTKKAEKDAQEAEEAQRLQELENARLHEARMAEINSDQTQEYNTKIGTPVSRVPKKNKLGYKRFLAQKEGDIKEVSGYKERTEMLGNVNVAGLNKLLKRDDLVDLYNKAYDTLKQEEFKNDKGGTSERPIYTFYGVGSNYGEAADMLIDAGYSKEGLFIDNDEMATLMTTMGDYVRTQNKIPNISSVEKMKILFDFDGDTRLEDDTENYVSEKQITRDTFKGITSSGYDTLLENIGLPNIEKEMTQNLFSAREKFHRELGTMFERGYKLGELLVEGGVETATQKMYAEKNEKAQIISELVEEKLIPRLEAESKKELTAEEIKEIKLMAIGAMIGGVNGVGVSFDVSDYIKVIDSFKIGLFHDGSEFVPGVAISKELFEQNGFELSGSLVNFYIPVLTAQYNDKASFEEVKQTFEEEFEGDWTISPSVSVSVDTYLFSLKFSHEDERTSEGIESKVDDMGDVLDKMFTDIQEGKSFEDISYIDSKGKEEKSVYNKMKETYDTYASSLTEEQQALFLMDLKQGSLNYYKTNLYNNASKSNFDISTFGIGRGFGNFTPITFIYVGGENLSLDWKKVIHSIDREREVTTTRIALERIGAEVVEYKGFQVLAIPNGSEYAISSKMDSIQAEYDKGNDMLYLTGDIRNISVAEYSMATGTQRTIVVGEGVTNEKGMLLDTTENLVSINSNLGFNIDYSKESLDDTEIVRGYLFNIIDTGTLTDRNTPGMMDLQRDIYNYKRTSTPVISDVWNQFVKVFTDDKMTKYASGEKADDILGLREYLTSTQDSLSDSEKVLILQSVSSNLMKKDALKAIEGKVMIEGGKTNLLDYDNKYTRAAFFNKIFENDLGDIASNINDARNRYYDKNKDKTEYTFTPMAEGDIAFTGVFSKRGNGEVNVNGLMPYTGAYNIASFEGGADMVPIEGKSIDIIDVLPTGYLENVKTILEEITGKTYDSLDAVKDALKSEDSAIKFDYDLFFAKMSECLNDAVIMKNLKMLVGNNEITLGASSTSEVYTPEFVAQKWMLGFTERKEDNDDDTDGGGDGDDNISSDPDGEDAGDLPDDNGPNI